LGFHFQMAGNSKYECSTKQLAECFHVTPQRITQYHGEGMPQLGRNRWDLLGCFEWKLAYDEQRFLERLADSASAQDEYYRAQARNIAVMEQRNLDRLARERGELIHVADLIPELNRTYVKVKQRLVGLESRLKTMIGQEQSKTVGKELRRILTELADDSERITKTHTPKKAKRIK
jgi:hypothetical protein